MKVVSGKVSDNAELLIRKVALKVDQVLVSETPVDTGRARANWFVFVGAPGEMSADAVISGDRKSDARGAANAQPALDQGARAIAGYKVSQGSIFIVNNVEYIIFLDQGSSSQSLAGMSAAAIQAGRELAARSKLLVRKV